MKLPPKPFAHIFGSFCDKKDPSLDIYESRSLLSERLVFQEKYDGFQIFVDFNDVGDLSVKHNGKPLPSSKLSSSIKSFIKDREAMMLAILESNYVLCLEWLCSRQSIFYDRLPTICYVTDVFDKKAMRFISSEKVLSISPLMGLSPVPLLITGVLSMDEVQKKAVDLSWHGPEVREGIIMRYEDDHFLIKGAQYCSHRPKSSFKHKYNIVRGSHD